MGGFQGLLIRLYIFFLINHLISDKILMKFVVHLHLIQKEALIVIGSNEADS